MHILFQVIFLKIMLSKNIENYKNAVISAGGEISLKNPDGLILCGGDDISPEFYNEENTNCKKIDFFRDKYEFELLEKFIFLKKPVLAICRGIQIVNVFFGGTLYQNIENHKNNDGTDLFHQVTAKERFLKNLYGEDFLVNSCHHQAIKDLGKNLCVTAISPDNVIEGIVHKSLSIIGVQWHPERIENGKLLFDYFLELCRHSSRFG